jgi:hypothetical protein
LQGSRIFFDPVIAAGTYSWLECPKLLNLVFLIRNSFNNIDTLLASYNWRNTYMAVACIDSSSFCTAANISTLPSKLGSEKGSF